MSEKLINDLKNAEYALEHWDKANIDILKNVSFDFKNLKLLEANKFYKPQKKCKYWVLKVSITGTPELIVYNPTNKFSITGTDWPIFMEEIDRSKPVQKWHPCNHLYEVGDPYCPVCDVFHRYVYELKEEE